MKKKFGTLCLLLAVSFGAGCGYEQSCGIADARCNLLTFALTFRRITESRFAYVVTSAGTITAYTISKTTGTLTPISTTTIGGAATALTVDPFSRFLFAVSSTATTVYSYTIDSRTGALAAVNSQPTGTTPVQAGVDPTGRYLYVSDSGTTTVRMFSIDQTSGALTPIGAGTFTVLTGPQTPTFDSAGRFAYVVTSSVARVNQLAIALDGSLTNIAAALIPGASPQKAAIDPGNHALYVPNNGAGTVSMYSIAADGSLTSLGTVSPGGAPLNGIVDPTGRFYYVRTGTSNLSMYAIDQTLYTLSPIGSGTVAAGLNSINIAIHPSGRFAYAADQSTARIYMYTIDSATGALNPLGSGYAPTVAGAAAGPAFDATGKFLYQADGTGSTISQYYIDSAGNLIPLGSVAAGATPKGPVALANYTGF